MATSGDESHSDLYECPVCLQDMVDRKPRRLQCHHSFCQECLLSLAMENTIKCPKCRQITTFKGSIEHLPINFDLQKMREREKMLISKELILCQLCCVSKSIFKCQDCNKSLCQTCTDRHNKIKHFSGHTVSRLCLKHHEVITHVCSRCIEGACFMCILSDHGEHESEVTDYEEGLRMLKQQVSKTEKETKEYLQVLEKQREEVTVNIQKQRSLKRDIIRRQREYVQRAIVYYQKISDANEILLHLESKEAEQQLLESHYNNAMARKKLVQDIKKKDDCMFLSKYKEHKKDINGSLACLAPYKSPEMHVTLPDWRAIDDPVPDIARYGTHETCAPRLIMTIKDDDKLQAKVKVIFEKKNILFVADMNGSQILQFSKSGELLKSHKLEEENCIIKGVSHFEGLVYVAHGKGTVTCFNAKSWTKVAAFQLPINPISRIYVVCFTKMIITEYNSPGRIFNFNQENDSLVTVVENLNFPTYITMAVTNEGIRYLITIEQDHCINVYDALWDLKLVIGKEGSSDGQLKTPKATALTHKGTILVADLENNRISEFQIDGTFLGHILTKKDDLKWPCALAYRAPCLWVTEFESPSIKVYQMYP